VRSIFLVFASQARAPGKVRWWPRRGRLARGVGKTSVKMAESVHLKISVSYFHPNNKPHKKRLTPVILAFNPPDLCLKPDLANSSQDPISKKGLVE
jgi:hypothetical protein